MWSTLKENNGFDVSENRVKKVILRNSLSGGWGAKEDDAKARRCDPIVVMPRQFERRGGFREELARGGERDRRERGERVGAVGS